MIILKKVKRPWIKQYHETKQHDPYYDTPAWRRKRKEIILRDQGLCQYCEEGKRRPGNTVDHTLPRRFFPEIEDDNTNLKVICDQHDGHKRKIESMCHDRHACVVKLREGGFIV
jgi:5-methylcytosine-specific restriction endonuclease McrA